MWYINEAVELSQSLVSLWKKYLIAVYFCIQFIDTFLKWIVFKLHTKLQLNIINYWVSTLLLCITVLSEVCDCSHRM